MVLKKASKVAKYSPQMVHKKSGKGPEKFFKVLRYSGPQVFKKSSKGQENAQKGPQRPHASGPQMILKLLKRSSTSSNSSKVLKRYSNRPQSPQKFINVLNSSVGSQFRKDPQCPENSLNSSKASGPQ